MLECLRCGKEKHKKEFSAKKDSRYCFDCLRKMLGDEIFFNEYGEEYNLKFLTASERKKLEYQDALHEFYRTKQRKQRCKVCGRRKPLRAYSDIGLRKKTCKRCLGEKGKKSPSIVRNRNRDYRKESEKFLASWEWRQLRYEALRKYGARCMLCGATPDDGVRICVDHIKPRYRYPELALDINNLQILCDICNQEKGAVYEDDFRKDT